MCFVALYVYMQCIYVYDLSCTQNARISLGFRFESDANTYQLTAIYTVLTAAAAAVVVAVFDRWTQIDNSRAWWEYECKYAKHFEQLNSVVNQTFMNKNFLSDDGSIDLRTTRMWLNEWAH